MLAETAFGESCLGLRVYAVSTKESRERHTISAVSIAVKSNVQVR